MGRFITMIAVSTATAAAEIPRKALRLTLKLLEDPFSGFSGKLVLLSCVTCPRIYALILTLTLPHLTPPTGLFCTCRSIVKIY